MYPKITICTVTLNCKIDLIKTIRSVQSQTYDNFNHVIKDGLSTDGLASIDFSQYRNTQFYSLADSGVYDAMNQSVEFSDGDYFLFLNAGDVLFSRTILSEIAKIIENNSNCHCFSGQTLQINNKTNEPCRLLGSALIHRIFPLSQCPHPSFIISRKIIESINPLFDADLFIASDYKQQLIIRKSNLWRVLYINKILSIMPLGGKSTNSISSYLRGYREVASFSYDLFGIVFLYILFVKLILNIFTRFYSIPKHNF